MALYPFIAPAPPTPPPALALGPFIPVDLSSPLRAKPQRQIFDANNRLLYNVTPPPTSQIKFHPGWYASSNNLNGSQVDGNGRNKTEMDLLGGSGFSANVQGYQTLSTWNNLETALGVYDFSSFVSDFNYLQSVLPGARYAMVIWGQTFSGTGSGASGTPAYILNDPGTYGSGFDGVHGGYWALDPGSGPSGGSAALWRAPVMNRYAAMFEALANTSFTTTAGPLAGQTFTFNNHPLIEFVSTQETSLSLATGSDYNDNTFATQYGLLMNRIAAAWTHTISASSANFTRTQATMNTVIDNLNVPGSTIANSAPDVVSTTVTSWGQKVYSGNHWNGTTFSGGTDYRGKFPYIAIAQSATYTSASFSLANYLAEAQALQASHLCLTIVTSGTYNWNTAVKPFINANSPLAVPPCPVNYAGRCQFT